MDIHMLHTWNSPTLNLCFMQRVLLASCSHTEQGRCRRRAITPIGSIWVEGSGLRCNRDPPEPVPSLFHISKGLEWRCDALMLLLDASLNLVFRVLSPSCGCVYLDKS
jgi:hypothetical protein